MHPNRAHSHLEAQANPDAKGGKNETATLSKGMRTKISPITYVCADAPPFLLVHEASDRTVGVYHSDEFVKSLKLVGATDVTYMRYEDGTGHGTFMANQQETQPAMEKFFERVLKMPRQ